MITLRKSNDRGVGRHGWLTSHHTFSFANYHDPKQMGFRTLRVINEDTVAPGRGFGAHQHSDMEIISIVLEGALAHKDSTGGEGVLRRGEVQRMSAGSGVVHSEFNGSRTEPVHFLQIWIQPNEIGGPAGYEEKHFDAASKTGQLRLVASQDGREGSVTIRQDAAIYAGILNADDALSFPLQAGRIGYVHVARGRVAVNGVVLRAGDAVRIDDEALVSFADAVDAEVLLFDLPR